MVSDADYKKIMREVEDFQVFWGTKTGYHLVDGVCFFPPPELEAKLTEEVCVRWSKELEKGKDPKWSSVFFRYGRRGMMVILTRSRRTLDLKQVRYPADPKVIWRMYRQQKKKR